jgi:hypothetical protein
MHRAPRDGGMRHGFVHDKRGVVEYCDENLFVKDERIRNSFRFAQKQL